MTRTVVEQITQAGVQKLRFSAAPGRYLTRAALAGAFIFVGPALQPLRRLVLRRQSPSGQAAGALAFSAALTLIVLLGGELFTGCTPGHERIPLRRPGPPGRNPPCLGAGLPGQSPGHSGALPAAGRLRLQWGAVGGLSGPDRPGQAVRPWYLLLLRGVLCNFLVCIGVFAGFRLQSETAKALVIALAITTFVLTGLEHSIANMAYFALHALLNGSADWAAMGWNLLWVTLGNLLGGAVLLGLPFGTPQSRKRRNLSLDNPANL